jgi:hypothetical protein
MMITRVDPAVSPLGGTWVTITGKGLTECCIVKVEGVKVNCSAVEENALAFQSPRFKDQGFKKIEVEDEVTGLHFTLEDVFLYCDLDELNPSDRRNERDDGKRNGGSGTRDGNDAFGIPPAGGGRVWGARKK